MADHVGPRRCRWRLRLRRFSSLVKGTTRRNAELACDYLSLLAVALDQGDERLLRLSRGSGKNDLRSAKVGPRFLIGKRPSDLYQHISLGVR